MISAIRPGVTTLRPIWPTKASPPPWMTGVPALSPSASAASLREPLDVLAEVDHVGRQLVEDVVEADLRVEVRRPAAGVAVVVAAHGRRVDVGGPAPGQRPGRPVGGVAQVRRRLVGLGLLLLEPEQLGRQPLRRHRRRAAAVVLASGVGGLADPLGLVGRADVHPHDRRADDARRTCRSRRRCTWSRRPRCRRSRPPPLRRPSWRRGSRTAAPSTTRRGPARPSRAAGG